MFCACANLHVPRRRPRHPLEDDRAEGPRVGEEGGPLAADHDLRRLARVQEVTLGQRVADEEVLEVPHPKVGDLVAEWMAMLVSLRFIQDRKQDPVTTSELTFTRRQALVCPGTVQEI